MVQHTPAILITGGARGIGKGLAAYFVARNWQTVICDLDAEAGRACLADMGQPENLHFIQADVAIESQVRATLGDTLAWAGRLDTLVNNAGLADPDSGPVEELTLEQWQRRIDVNLTGAFLMAKHAIPHLRKTQGNIINIASSRALQSEPNSESYAASKGGLVALTHALAVSLGPDVRVNSISPGWIDVRAWQVDAPKNPEPLSRADHHQHPAGRVGSPGDVAAMVDYLTSPGADFVTGQNFVLDGGMTRKMIYRE